MLMKKNLLKTISVLLSMIIVLSVTCVFSFAENTASIKGFLVAPSQYTNMNNFGVHIENTINGNSSVTSLGNFGGYVTYEFSEPVYNSADHAAGIDFVVTGNAFASTASAQEPGQVWVSQDRQNWYALAGSEHYEDETIWNYTVTYKRNAEKETVCLFEDSMGDSGAVSTATAARYPDASIYTLQNIPEDNLSLSGILLRKARTASTSNVIETRFGYVDCFKNPSTGAVVNPYAAYTANDGRDGMFDISWAVDENGIGVNLSWVKYIKVQTAVFIDSGAFGEKSTEVTQIRLAPSAETGRTEKPSYIRVGDKSLDISGDERYFDVSLTDGEFTVEVGSGANVYINNARGTSKTFESATEKGIIRVIVQSGDNEPLIYYINTKSASVAPSEPITEPTTQTVEETTVAEETTEETTTEEPVTPTVEPTDIIEEPDDNGSSVNPFIRWIRHIIEVIKAFFSKVFHIN